IPTSAIAATAVGFRVPAGALPAERTSIASPARWVRNPAAIWERPALWTQTNNTVGVVMESLLSCRSGSGPDFGIAGSRARVDRCTGTPELVAEREGHIDQPDQHRHFDQRSHHPGERLAGGGAVGGDRDRDGEFEIITRRGE